MEDNWKKASNNQNEGGFYPKKDSPYHYRINVGDVVRLKSGGPLMTVCFFNKANKTFACSWFPDLASSVHTISITGNALEKVEIKKEQKDQESEESLTPKKILEI